MAVNQKIKEESSRIISTLLVCALEDCREGDMELAEGLGLSVKTMQELDRLKPDQVTRLSGRYMRGLSGLDVISLNAEILSKRIEQEAAITRDYEMIDEFILRGACKTMMKDLFGLRQTQTANRKRFLNYPTVKGRLPSPSDDEKRSIYYSWLKSINTPDFRDRLLFVARDTEQPLSRIYREVQIIEEVSNPINKNAHTLGDIHG